MQGRFYGLSSDCSSGLPQCAKAAKEQLTALFTNGAVYAQFLYPYFDSLLMSDAADGHGLLFGTHSLIFDEDGRLGDCDLTALEPDCRALTGFLTEGLYVPQAGEALVGGWEQFVPGSPQPWALREHSRRFCSFCEHIARMEGVKMLGLTGGYAAVALEDEGILDRIAEIFAAKTAGRCRVLRAGAAAWEEL